MPTVLVVEDDALVQRFVDDALGSAGYDVWTAQDAREARVLAHEVRPQLVVLDLMLPDGNGLVLCGEFAADPEAQIVVCSATRREDDVALALRMGAADFLHKPFTESELRARVDAAFRRRAAPTDAARRRPVHRLGRLVIDEGACCVTVDGREVAVTPTEFRLLAALAARRGDVVPHDQLRRQVLGADGPATAEALGVHARRLRARLAVAELGGAVQAVRGFGYRLDRRAVGQESP